MAIDSRQKRQSAAWVGYPGPVSVLPAGSISQAARQQIAWTYRGILVQVIGATVYRFRTILGVGL